MKLIFLLPMLLFVSCYAQGPVRMQKSNPNLPPNEPGKCYAKCQTAGEIILTDKSYAVYIGDDIENVALIDTTFHIPAGKKWVKKKTERPCASPDPNDCLVWCLVEVPAKEVTRKILTDLSQTTEYEVKRLVLGTRENTTMEWKEVVCENKVSSSLINQICDKLLREEYTTLKCNGGFLSHELKEAIKAYQKDNFLPIGNLNIETLNHMGIKI